MADGEGRKLLENTLLSVASGELNSTATERMRASLAYALLVDGEYSIPGEVHNVLSWERRSSS